MPAFPEVSPLGIGNAVRSPAFEFLQAIIYSVICARAGCSLRGAVPPRAQCHILRR
jgi:hypothetical protein